MAEFSFEKWINGLSIFKSRFDVTVIFVWLDRNFRLFFKFERFTNVSNGFKELFSTGMKNNLAIVALRDGLENFSSHDLQSWEHF